MSCCISSAVCCALVTASMSGIALGYNYSLAEYIDLKETNVSVYLKRGVFDDEIADDMDWRRSGHMPVQGHLKDSNLVTGGPAGPEEMPLRSGRRLDDSLVISDDQHKFEGSLMRLTAKPPDGQFGTSSQSPEPVTSDSQMAEILQKYPMGSLEQMKAIHGLMNMRRSGNQRNTVLPPTLSAEGYDMSGRRVMARPEMLPIDKGPIIGETYKKLNPARFAVPDESIRDPASWFLPKNQIPDSYRRTMDIEDYDNIPSSRITIPQPFRMTTDVKRPTRSKPQRTTQTVPKPKDILGDQNTANQDPDLDKFKNQLLMHRFDVPRLRKDEYKEPSSGREFKSEEDYEDEANKGLPIRKKRNRRDVDKKDSNFSRAFSATNNKHKSKHDGNKVTLSILISKLSTLNREINTKKDIPKLDIIIPSVTEKTSFLVR